MADMRKCIGSTTFGIEAHEAPPEEFPAQPSQKDGLGRMCKPHWTEYVRALHRDALARKVAEGGAATEAAPTVQSEAAARVSTKRAARVAAQAAGKVPAADGSVPRETLAVTIRRAKLEAKLAEVGVASDEGQRTLEAAAKAAARGRKPMAEAVHDEEQSRTIDQIDAALAAGDIAEGEGA